MSGLRNLRSNALSCGEIQIDNVDVRAFEGKSGCDGPTNAASGACNDGCLAV
jgi:hypothetical protein